MATPREITRLLVAAREEEPDAVDRLLPLVYDELRLIARRQLYRRRPGQTLDTTALVHEAYLRLVDQPRVGSSSTGRSAAAPRSRRSSRR